MVQELRRDRLSVAVTCRILRVSTSGSYDWLSRVPSEKDYADAELLDTIGDLRAVGRGTYGVRRFKPS
ncbi:hypothetical protein IWX81_002146 [Salinibacterium sp. CAN_S4]|uniref:hypothetical protein n=1 Tax=Salinibacterium sp. CAN_S4 TaxID=2787727 RepID=UPI0018EFB5D9